MLSHRLRPTRLSVRDFVSHASPPPPPKYKQGWKRPPALATAQTLTLFSSSPQGLLIALRSTLEGMTSLASRLVPLPPSQTSSDHVLLYSLSKHLPSDILGQAISLLRGGESAPDAPKIARVGMLSSSLPSSLISKEAGQTTGMLHSVALSLLPGLNAVPFRSEIPGRSQVSVGRWPDRKPSWQSRTQQLSDLLDDGNPALPTRSWREIWGRENIEGKVPSQLEGLSPSTILLFSDPSPQGLLEGLASRFPAASVLGLKAPPTPFETGRDQTMLLNLPGTDKIHSDGAVGVALIPNFSAAGTKEEIAVPKVVAFFQGLEAFGKKRAITSAQGNIISTLDSMNAAQQFLRDIQARSDSALLEQSQDLSEAEARRMAATVKKDQDFFLAVYNDAGKELMVARILSGHPKKGTLSLDTDVDLGPGAGGEQGTMGTYAQFMERAKTEVDPLEIPGPDPSIWATPRFMFLTLPSQAPQAAESGGKHQVMALPNLFVAASERGWIAGSGSKQDKYKSTLDKQGGSIISSTVPLSRAILSLGGD